jgi:hypothetical protein
MWAILSDQIRLLLPRLTLFLVFAVGLLALMYFTMPEQLPVAIYKITLTVAAAILGYWLDRGLFPYGRPDSYLNQDWRNAQLGPFGIPDAADYPVIDEYRLVYAAAMIRRAIVVAAVILSVSLGL